MRFFAQNFRLLRRNVGSWNIPRGTLQIWESSWNIPKGFAIFLAMGGNPRQNRAVMHEARKILRLELDPEGAEPVVLVGRWELGDKAEHLSSLCSDKEHAKVLRRATCILLLLVKYQCTEKPANDKTEKEKKPKSDIPLMFREELSHITWIKSLVNGVQKTDAQAWIKNHFKITNCFFSANPGAKGKNETRKLAKVTFHADILPPQDLRFFDQGEELEGDKLLDKALMLEAVHWVGPKSESSIEELLRSGRLRPRSNLPKLNQNIGAVSPQDRFLPQKLAIMAADQSYELMQKSVNDLQFGECDTYPEFWKQLALEFDAYRERCKPFFNSMKQRARVPGTPLDNMNRSQAKVFRRNSLRYVAYVADGTPKFMKTLSEFYDSTALRDLFGSPRSDRELTKAVEKIVRAWSDSNGLRSEKNEPKQAHNYSEIMAVHFTGFSHSRLRYSKEPGGAVVLGAFYGQRVAFYDFMTEVCWPIIDPYVMEPDALEVFFIGSLRLKIRVREFLDLIDQYCIYHRDYLGFITGLRLTLTDQRRFLWAMYCKIEELNV